MNQLTEISDRIVQIVDQADEKTILGVRLGAALKWSFPSFTPAAYQCKNLRQFIKKYVPQVIEKIHTGVDVTYTIATAAPVVNASDTSTDTADPSPTDSLIISLPVNPIAWKAYSNPAFRLAIMANPTTGEIRTMGEHEAPPSPWVAIPKLSSEIHLQIAQDFIATLTDASKATTLKSVLAGPQWYVTFFATTKRLGLSKQYGLFKREHLIRQFTAALHEHGVTAAPSSPRRDLPPPRTPSRRPTHENRVGDETNLRELVARLAHSLPIDELRSIRIPIGLVIDALDK